MNTEEKIQELRHRIELELAPLINRNYRYLMMCEHTNIGDTLIMEGEFQFLKTIRRYKCKEFTTMNSFESRCPLISSDDLLIMKGSGSFGDVWPTAPNFWRFVLKQYPDNPILFMPQTIYFSDVKNLEEMAALINEHKGVVTLCVRDEESYHIAKKYFRCDLHLVPDMAFYMDCHRMAEKAKKYNQSDKKLLVMRNDKEQKCSKLIEDLRNSNVHCEDWPTIGLFGRIERMKRKLLKKKMYTWYDLYIRFVYRPYIIRHGLKFMASYSDIYATRMHAGIFAMLLGKRSHFLDNSYGKLSRVFNTWLKDVDNVSLDE